MIVKHLDEFSDVELLLLKKGLVVNKLINNDHIITVIDEKLQDIQDDDLDIDEDKLKELVRQKVEEIRKMKQAV